MMAEQCASLVGGAFPSRSELERGELAGRAVEVIRENFRGLLELEMLLAEEVALRR